PVLDGVQGIVRMAEEPVGDPVGRLPVAVEQFLQGRSVAPGVAGDQFLVPFGERRGRDGSHGAAYTPLVQTARGDVLFATILSGPARRTKVRTPNRHDLPLPLAAGAKARRLGPFARPAGERCQPA